jgi:hypothetical protein
VPHPTTPVFAYSRLTKPGNLSIAKYARTLNFELTEGCNFCEAVPSLGTLRDQAQQIMAAKINLNFPTTLIPVAYEPTTVGTINKNTVGICPTSMTQFIGGRPRLFTTDGAGWYTLHPNNFTTDLFVARNADGSFNPSTFIYNFFSSDNTTLINRVFGFWFNVWQYFSRAAW